MISGMFLGSQSGQRQNVLTKQFREIPRDICSLMVFTGKPNLGLID
jgi:hypothetical protein